jgi:choline-glycine betaine transporter
VIAPVIGVAVLAISVWGDLRPGQASPYNTLPWLTTALIATGIIMLSRFTER